MNYYSHHIGDFNNSTRHLTRVEQSVYRDSIEHYYNTESVLTNDFDKLARRLLCVTEIEQQALIDILNEFYIKTIDGWAHELCDIQIAKYRANTSNKAKAGIASALIRKIKTTELHTCSTGVQRTNNHKPITNNHKPETNKSLDISNIEGLSNIVSADKKSAPIKKGKTLDINWQLPKTWGDWAISEKPQITPDEIRIIAEDFKDYWLANANHSKSKKLDWEAAWRGWIRRQNIPTKQFKTNAQRREENNKLAGDEFLNGSDFLANSEIIIEKEIYNA